MRSNYNSLSDLRIALTGATGFIGRALLPAILSAGADVVGLTRKPDNNELVSSSRLSWLKWDLLDSDIPYSALQGIDCVCHLAAHIPENLDDPTEAEPCFRANALGTLRLLQAGRAMGLKHFVYLSSGQVYPPATRAMSETDRAHPSDRATYYLSSKLMGEIFVDYFARGNGLVTTTLRPGSVYGPGMHYCSTISRFIQHAKGGGRIKLNGMGRYSVDVVFVGDIVFAILSALQRRAGGTFNVGSGKATSIAEVAREIVRQCGADPFSIEYVPGFADLGFPPLDISKAHRLLDYSPTPLEEGLKRTILAAASKESTAGMA